MGQDNRRRVKTSLLEEIEEYNGGNFTEKLLKWKMDKDNLSENQDNLSENQEDRRENTDKLSIEDIETIIDTKLKEFFEEKTPIEVY